MMMKINLKRRRNLNSRKIYPKKLKMMETVLIITLQILTKQIELVQKLRIKNPNLMSRPRLLLMKLLKLRLKSKII